MDMVSESVNDEFSIAAKPGKYLIFFLDKELYGIEIMLVQEIIGIMQVTRVPKTPDYMRGVINLRGKVIPLIDIRIKFGLEKKEDAKKTCIIVVQINIKGEDSTIGIIVDEVSEVINISRENIQPPPSVGMTVDTSIITGLGKTDENVIMLLDVNSIFNKDDFVSLREQG